MASKQAELGRWHDWTDPDFFAPAPGQERRLIPLFIRQLLPKRLERTKLTIAGWMLILVSMGIGSAAYNTSSNILFMALSLILSSLILSGILSLINLKHLNWELVLPSHLQVAEVGAVDIRLVNRKKVFPSMSLAFRMGHSETALTERVFVPQALRAGESSRIEWTVVPGQRGRMTLQLQGVESKFPFGFIRKTVGEVLSETVLVWPALVPYRLIQQADGRQHRLGDSRLKIGAGSDLLKIRNYVPGDAPRLIHWRATARTGKLIVRQLAQEGAGGYHLFVDTEPKLWNQRQFECLCGLACALAGDLFHSGRLETVQAGPNERLPVRSLRELYGFFDEIALLEAGPVVGYAPPVANLITFRPLGEEGVAIYVDGARAGESEA